MKQSQKAAQQHQQQAQQTLVQQLLRHLRGCRQPQAAASSHKVPAMLMPLQQEMAQLQQQQRLLPVMILVMNSGGVLDSLMLFTPAAAVPPSFTGAATRWQQARR